MKNRKSYYSLLLALVLCLCLTACGGSGDTIDDGGEDYSGNEVNTPDSFEGMVKDSELATNYAMYWGTWVDADNNSELIVAMADSGDEVRFDLYQDGSIEASGFVQFSQEYSGDYFYNEFDGVWEFEDVLRNVWSALAGLEGWGDSSMASENPDLANGPRDTYGFNAIPSGNFYPNGPDLGSRFKFSDSAVSYWTTDLLSYGGGIVTLNNMEYGIDYAKWGNQSERGQSVRCVKD